MISIHHEETFERLRYSFGGDRPSQTAHLTLSARRLTALALEPRNRKSGIPTSAPCSPKCTPLSIPPILCMQSQCSISNYSKALRGLSVQSQVICIFTYTSISPGPLLRQCPSRYAIHAGRNLPDKEFRYLRTVIVTAAVHWGLSLMLRFLLHLPLTFQHWAGVSFYTSSFDFAETYVFAKQSLGPFLCDLYLYRHPFSLSYGVILPSSLTKVIPPVL